MLDVVIKNTIEMRKIEWSLSDEKEFIEYKALIEGREEDWFDGTVKYYQLLKKRREQGYYCI